MRALGSFERYMRFWYTFPPNARAEKNDMPIDLRLLRFAQALVEHGSFSRAAEALHVAQPSLSRGIQELESRVGVPLFVRSRMGNEITDVGRVFMEHAEGVLAHSRDLEREVALIKGVGSVEVSVAMGPYVIDTIGTPFALDFARSNPGWRLRVIHSDPVMAVRLMRSSKVDLLVVEASLIHEEDLEVVASLAPLPGHIVVRRGHPLLAKARPTLGDVLDYPYAQVVMLPPRLLKPILDARRSSKRKSDAPFPAIECPTVRMALGVVADSDAFTFSSLGLINDEFASGRVVPLSLRAPWLQSQWSILRLRKRVIPGAVTAAVEAVQRTLADTLHREQQLAALHNG